MKVSVALALVLAITLREVPASAAAPDLSEARRRFVAAVQSSDQAVASAETAIDSALREAAALAIPEAQRSREAIAKLLTALRDFKAQKARILTRDLSSSEKLLVATGEYARAIVVLAAVITLRMPLVGTPWLPITIVAAVVSAVAVLVLSLPELMKCVGMILRAEGFQGAGDEADSVSRWFAKNVSSGPTGELIRLVGAVAADMTSAENAMRAAQAAARDAQARLQAAPKPPVPALGPPKKPDPVQLPATFEGDLGGSFHVSLVSGQATRPAGEAALRGRIAIASKANPNVVLTVEGDVTLTAGSGGWASLRGHGTARISGFGPALAVPNSTVGSQGVSALTLAGDEAAVRGCTHTVGMGSVLSPSRLTLAGSLRCGPWSMASSTLALEGGSVSGGGTFTAWSKRFAMTYSASGDTLSVRGSLSGVNTPWARIPGLEAEYRIEGPKLDLKLEGPSLSRTFGAGKVNVRSTAKKPDGNPWSTASATPGTVVVPAPPSDGIPVPVPNLPPPADVERAARDLCESAAKKLVGGARDRALDACRSGHPAPPGLPNLPASVSLKVGEVFP
ncbi:MAG: hypothetical protein ABI768_10340 [Acidobacteriota bacterium]